MGLFNELDLKDAPDDPNPPNGTYEAILSKVEPGKTDKKPDKKFIIFTYLVQGGEYDKSPVSEWFSVNADDDARTKSWLKARLLALNVPADRVDDVDAEDLVGTECLITLKKNGAFTNINKVTTGSTADSVSSY